MTLEHYCRDCAPEAPTPDTEPLTSKPTESTALNAKMAPFIQYLIVSFFQSFFDTKISPFPTLFPFQYYAETIAASPELQAEIETKVETKVFRQTDYVAIEKFLEDPKYEPINMEPLGPHKLIFSRIPVADKNLSNQHQYPVSYEVFEASLNQKTTKPKEPTPLFRR